MNKYNIDRSFLDKIFSCEIATLVTFISMVMLCCISFTFPVLGQSANCHIELNDKYSAELDIEANYFPVAKLYLAGEIHNIKSNPIVKFQLFKHLHANKSVRYYLIEGGPATSYLLNKYLVTGNEFYLDSYFLIEPDFWSNLRKYNNGLASNNKIWVIGFDFDLNNIYQKALVVLLNEVQTFNLSIKNKIDSMILNLRGGVNDSNRKELNNQLVQIFDSFSINEKNKIKSQYTTIKSIITNKTPVTSHVKRDKITFETIVSSNIDFKYGNIFGQYGISHVNRRLKNLSYMLENDKRSPFYHNMIAIGYQYFNCESIWENDTTLYKSIGIINQTNPKISLHENNQFELTIIDLSCIDLNIKRLGKVVDYIIICKDQKFTTPR